MPESSPRLLRIDLPPEVKSFVGNAVPESGLHARLPKQNEHV
jgi:hypothetical protein